jgi:hypothetical protein
MKSSGLFNRAIWAFIAFTFLCSLQGTRAEYSENARKSAYSAVLNALTHPTLIPDRRQRGFFRNDLWKVIEPLVLKSNPAGLDPRQQILSVLRGRGYSTLSEFLSGFYSRLPPKTLRASHQLTPYQLAAVLKFYRFLDENENTLIRQDMANRNAIEKANQAAQITRWPVIPERRHSRNQPIPGFSEREWTKARAPFFDELFKLEKEWLLILAALTNFGVQHLGYTHLPELRQHFIRFLQFHAILRNDPEIARIGLSTYLANASSDRSLIRRHDQIELQFDDGTDELRTLADFLLSLQIWSVPQLKRFFASGKSPVIAIPPSGSKTLGEVLTVLEKNAMEVEPPADAEALRALVERCLSFK